MFSGLKAGCCLFSWGGGGGVPHAVALFPTEFQQRVGPSRHQSHFPNEQIVFSSSLNLIFEPICAGSFLLFVFLTLSTPGPTVIIGLRPLLGAQLLFNSSNDFAEHEKKKAPVLGFCLPFRCWLFTKSLHFSVELAFLALLRKPQPEPCPLLYPQKRARWLPMGVCGDSSPHCMHLHGDNVESLSGGWGGNRGIPVLESPSLPVRKGRMWWSRKGPGLGKNLLTC